MTENVASKQIAVRNSITLGVLHAVVTDARVPWSVVELAGRGITANAAGTRWVLTVGKPSLDGMTLADKLIELSEYEERLVDLWQAYERGEVEILDFEARLAELVTAMERWPSAPEKPVKA